MENITRYTKIKLFITYQSRACFIYFVAECANF